MSPPRSAGAHCSQGDREFLGRGGVSQADRPAVMRLDRAPRQRMAPFGAGDGPARRPRLQRRRG